MSAFSDLVIMIPSKRPPPVRTIVSFPEMTTNYQTVILADPEFFDEHAEAARGTAVKVVRGGDCVGKQIFMSYQLAHLMKYSHWVRFDDDLGPDSFVGKEYDPYIDDVIEEMYGCLQDTRTTLAGIANSANTYWLGKDYNRTYGLIHGGCNISIGTPNPEQFINPKLKRSGDVWRTCAHREKDGAVGRVAFIGFRKSGSTMNKSTIPDSQEILDETREMIISRFPTLVSCDGVMSVNGKTLPNWRMKRGPYRAER